MPQLAKVAGTLPHRCALELANIYHLQGAKMQLDKAEACNHPLLSSRSHASTRAALSLAHIED